MKDRLVMANVGGGGHQWEEESIRWSKSDTGFESEERVWVKHIAMKRYTK